MYQKPQESLVDLYSDSDEPSTGHVILTYDIECEMESGTPDPQEIKNQITSMMHFMILAYKSVLGIGNG